MSSEQEPPDARDQVYAQVYAQDRLLNLHSALALAYNVECFRYLPI